MTIPTLDVSGGEGEAAKEKKAEKPRKEAPKRSEKRQQPKPEKRREQRKAEPVGEAEADDDDGWNGPVPSFLSLSAD